MIQEATAVVAVGLIGAAVLAGIGVSAAAGAIFGLKTIMMQTSFWTVLASVSPILAPIVSLGLMGLVKGWWNHEKRIRDLETSDTRKSRAIFGDEDDDRREGLSADVKELSDRVDSLEQAVDRLRRTIEESNGN